MHLIVHSFVIFMTHVFLEPGREYGTVTAEEHGISDQKGSRRRGNAQVYSVYVFHLLTCYVFHVFII